MPRDFFLGNFLILIKCLQSEKEKKLFTYHSRRRSGGKGGGFVSPGSVTLNVQALNARKGQGLVRARRKL